MTTLKATFVGDTTDLVLLLDKFQGSPEGIECPGKDKRGRGHGRLTAHASGSFLICGLCDVVYKVDGDLLSKAQAFDAADVWVGLTPAPSND